MNHIKELSLIILLAGTSFMIKAQYSHPITEGTIEFERSVNKFALIQQSFGPVTSNAEREEFGRYKTSHPQFLVQKSKLTFSKDSSLFIPSDESDQEQNTFYGKPIAEQHNIVFNDFMSGRSVTQKKIFGNTYLMTDSTRKIIWKLTNDTREIAGYTCRRANGVMLDSIYIVAFYTGEIAVQGGPESFSGLPGMILGVVLPHDHVSWFATKIIEETIPMKNLQVPVKGKQVTFKELVSLLKVVASNLHGVRQIPTEILY